MKFKFIIGVILAISVIFYMILTSLYSDGSLFWLNGPINTLFNSPVDYTCTEDADCVLGSISCFYCSSCAAVNREWNPICVFPTNIMCEMLPCFGVPRCINKKCELVNVESFIFSGTILDNSTHDESVTLKLNQTSRDCLLNYTQFEINVTKSSFEKLDLKENTSYMIQFHKATIDLLWEIEEANYDTVCWYKHEEDLSYRFVHEIVPDCCERDEGGGLSCRCENDCWGMNAIYDNITIQTKIELTNHATYKINFDLKSSIHDYSVLRPNMNHWEEPSFDVRLIESKVDYCDILYTNPPYSIEPNSKKNLTFDIKCKNTFSNPNMLWNEFVQYVNISFTDELGSNHNFVDSYNYPTFKLCNSNYSSMY